VAQAASSCNAFAIATFTSLTQSSGLTYITNYYHVKLHQNRTGSFQLDVYNIFTQKYENSSQDH